MTPRFLAAFKLLIGHEGGYVNDPNDKGGETKFGISKRAYPDVNIAALTLADAQAIYWRDYWQKVRADNLPGGLGLLVFDAAVNNGVPAASKWLQGVAKAPADGAIGPITMKAVSGLLAKLGTAEVAAMFQGRRIAAMAAMDDWKIYGNGWSKRLSFIMWQAATFP